MNSKEKIQQMTDLASRVMPADGEVWLFGSRARGTAKPDSDWDILILIDKDRISLDDYGRYAYPFQELGWDRIEKVHDVETIIPIELAKHEDINDEAQTIHYGGIVKTVATGKSAEHNILAGPNTVVTDIVEYENLSTEETYVLEGELFDKTTGQLTGIKATTELKPTTPNGKATVTFTFDSSALKNHALVAYETLTLKTRIVSEHKNPDDPDQTVFVPEILTKVDKPDGKSVIDTVTYTNLILGKTYVVKGYFVDKETGKKIKGSDGQTTFVPTTPNGTVDVELDLAKAADDVVAFEYCYINSIADNNLVATHTDINDKAQTLKYNPPKTGDDFSIFIFGGLALAAAIGLAFMVRRKRKAE